MSAIHIGCVFWNDPPDQFEEVLKSWRRVPNLKSIILIDGAYRDYPPIKEFEDAPKHYSTNGCYELALEYGDKVITGPDGGWHDEWSGQCLKRSEYFRYISTGEFCLDLDADLRLFSLSDVELVDDRALLNPGIIDITKLDKEYHRIYLQPKGTEKYRPYVRVHKVYWDLVYRYAHQLQYRKSLITDPDNRMSGLRRLTKTTHIVNTEGNPLVAIEYPETEERAIQDKKWVEVREERMFNIKQFLRSD